MITNMSPETITLIIWVSLIVLLSTGFPVAFVLLMVSVIGIFVWVRPAALYSLVSVVLATTTLDYLIALPLFILMASILESSGIGSTMYSMIYKWFSGLRGGLAIGTVVISAVVAAMSGTASTATISMGLIAYPEMTKRHYHKSIAIGCILGGGCLGPLIPPSVPMIIVASMSGISIGKLFIGGFFPGLLTASLFIIYIGLRCLVNPKAGPSIPFEQRSSWKDKLISLRAVALPVVLVFLVLGLIYLGVSTPTEAGGIGAFGAFLCAVICGGFSWAKLRISLLTSLKLTVMLIWLIVAGNMFSSLLAATRSNLIVQEMLLNLSSGNPVLVLAVMLAITLFFGMFIDIGPIIIITLPLFVPVVNVLGIDLLWFGLIYTMTLLIGLITPPFGIVLFYFKGLQHQGVTIMDIYKAAGPFIFLMILALILCMVFPEIAVWLPGQMITR